MIDALFGACSSMIRVLPRRIRYRPADAVSTGVMLLQPGLIDRVAANFARAFRWSPGDPHARALARASVLNFGRMAIDFLWTSTLPNSTIEAVTELSGAHHLWGALDAGRGVVLALPHMGCWDVAAARASAAGLPITIVTEPTWAARTVAGSRLRPGICLVPRNRSLRPLLRALARNQAVVLLSDLARPGLATVEVPFFGLPANLPNGPARLAHHTGAPIVAVACVRTSACRYRVVFRPPLWPDAGPGSADDRELTSRLAYEFQMLITSYPAQWYPFGRIWLDQERLSPR